MSETVALRLAYEEAGLGSADCDFCFVSRPIDELVATGSFGPTGLMCVDGIRCDRENNETRNTNTAS